MELSTKPVADALEHLETSVALVESTLGRSDAKLANVFRTSAIKSFEYCYALSLKLIERWLEERMSPEDLKVLNFRNFIRAAWERGLVTDSYDWTVFREMRNTTAHTYDIAKAAVIFEGLPKFVAAVRHLLTKLEGRADAS